MRSLLFVTAFLIFIPFILSCKKNGASNESDLYGAWSKGSNTGDTLWFMKKNGQDIIRVATSFNPILPMYSEKEYKFKNGELRIKSYAPTSQEFFPITSFKWTDPQKEFTIQNSELFPFLSSIITYKYKKI